MSNDAPTPTPPIPGLTPTGYQRTQGGNVRWQPPTVEHLQALLPAYEILSLLGHGGMGAVYKARQKTLDRLVAIKILPPEAAQDGDANFVERFKNEARTMGKMNHPAIVHVHDFGETTEGQLYFVMEFVEGTDVQQMIHSQGKLPPAHALAIAAHVCDALQYAHTHGVVHRDIKPANVLINMEGQVKVADFGLAKLEDAGQSPGLTMTGMSMGTPDYIAPEALTLGMTADHRADLYAVGVMIYHMLTGEVPRGKFKQPSQKVGSDVRFDAIIDRAMENDRNERYQTAQQIRQALDAILATPVVQSGGQSSAAIPKQAVAQKPVARGPQQPGQRPASPANVKSQIADSKSKTPLLIGIGAAAAVVIGAVVMFSGKPKQPGEAKVVQSFSSDSPTKAAILSANPPAKAVSPPPQGSATAPQNAGASKDTTAKTSAPKVPTIAKGAPSDMPIPVPAQWIDATADCKATAPASQIEDAPNGWRAKELIPVIRLPSPDKKDVVIRVRHQGQVAPSVRETTGVGHYLGVVNGIGSAWVAFFDYSPTKLSESKLAQSTVTAFKPKDTHETVLAAQGRTLSLWFDGHLVATAEDTRLNEGKFRLRVEKGCIIEKVEYADLTEAVAQPVAGAKQSSPGLQPAPAPPAAQPMQNQPAKATADGLKPATTLPAATAPHPARLPDPAKWVKVFDTPESVASQGIQAQWKDGTIRLRGALTLSAAPVMDCAIRAKVRFDANDLEKSTIEMNLRNGSDT